MKLAYITRAYPFAQLGETFLAPEIRSLASFCDELHVIPARPYLRRSAFKDASANIFAVRVAAVNVRMLASAFAEAATHPRRAARALLKVLAPRYRPSAKLKNLLVFPSALAIARYVRRHRIDRIHAHWLTTPATAAYIASFMTDVPWSCTAHAHDVLSGNLLRQKVESARFVRVIARRNLLDLAQLAGRSEESLHLIHVGVDIPVLLAERELTNRPLQIASAARLDPIKGHDYLIHALHRARERGLQFHCDIAGNGPEEARLRSLIARLGLGDCVKLRGVVPSSTLLDEFRNGRYDVVVLTSVELAGQHEGIPVALIEAMAHAMPCIATATGCIPELIDGTTGILVPQRDSHALAEALIRVNSDPVLRRRLGAAARSRVIDAFDVKQTACEVYRLIRSDGAGSLEPARAVSSTG